MALNLYGYRESTAVSLPDFAAAVASGTAGTLAAGAITSGTAWARTTVRTLMRRGTAAEQDNVIAALDDQESTPEELAERVLPFLHAHLDVFPEAITEFKALTVTGPTVYNQRNTGDGVFIGGDNHGGLTINHGGPTA
ncbi:hypothetical protein [Streptomyces rubiginosohelvolus]|uniref:Uncharacterized protein n=1 Tax=Streptomyces rubiginosohelvolus TaxID=67362 RepID=A0ABW6F0P3_9ACTN